MKPLDLNQSSDRFESAVNSGVRLREHLRNRLIPIAVLVAVVISISAPLAYVLVAGPALEDRARGMADRVAADLREEMQKRPHLWRYDFSKLQVHLQRHAEVSGDGKGGEVVRFELADEEGRWIDVGLQAPKPSQKLHWLKAEDLNANESKISLWVGLDRRPISRGAYLLLAIFVPFGCLLAGLMVRYSLRNAGDAEQQIDRLFGRLTRSQQTLARLNEDLEEQVEQRSRQLRQALADLEDKEKHLREISSRAWATQEEERRSLARDLHDETGPALTAVRINLQLIAQQAELQNPKLAGLAKRAIEVSDQAMEELRRILNRLAPAALGDLGLGAAIERCAADFNEVSGVEVALDCDEAGVEALMRDRGFETTAYRLVQESLTNVTRHAEAQKVRVAIRMNEAQGENEEKNVAFGVQKVSLSIEDDGVGFVTDEVHKKGRRGLQGMQERVELVGGRLTIISQPGEGTRVQAEFPVRVEGAEGVEDGTQE